MTWTTTQTDAIYEAKETRPGWSERPSADVAADLAQEGHPAFRRDTIPDPREGASHPAPAAGLSIPAPRGAPATGDQLAALRARAAEVRDQLQGTTDRERITKALEGAKDLWAIEAALALATRLLGEQEAMRAEFSMIPASAGAPAETTGMVPAREEKHLPATEHAHVGGFGIEGAEDLDGSDLLIPWLALTQNVGKGNGNPGTFKLTSEEEGTHERQLIVLNIQKTREVMMPYSDKKAWAAKAQELLDRHRVTVPADASVACRSNDRLTPVPQAGGVVCDSCAKCPLTKWETIGGDRVPPDCGESYVVLVQDVETGMPAYWRIRSSAIKPWKNLQTLLTFSCAKLHPLYKGTGSVAPTAAYSFTVQAKEIKGENDYWVPVFSKLTPIQDQNEIEGSLALKRAVLARGVADKES